MCGADALNEEFVVSKVVFQATGVYDRLDGAPLAPVEGLPQSAFKHQVIIEGDQSWKVVSRERPVQQRHPESVVGSVQREWRCRSIWDKWNYTRKLDCPRNSVDHCVVVLGVTLISQSLKGQ